MHAAHSVRVFLLEKRRKVDALSERLAARGISALAVVRDSDAAPVYAGSNQDDEVLEITQPALDWSGLVAFAKQERLDFSVLCGDGFRGIRIDYCPRQLLPHLDAR